MLWGGRWEGGSCLGTHVRIKDFKIKKKRNMKLRKRTQPNPSKDTSFLIKLHPIPSPLEVTTVMTSNNHFLAFSLWFSTIGIGISLKIIVKLLAFALYKWNYTVYRGFVSHLSVDTM